jgi:hypothetical protein
MVPEMTQLKSTLITHAYAVTKKDEKPGSGSNGGENPDEDKSKPGETPDPDLKSMEQVTGNEQTIGGLPVGAPGTKGGNG